MVVDDLHVIRAAVMSDEAQAPLVVDADTVLALAITAQRLEAIAGRNFQVFHPVSSVEHLKLASRDGFKRLEPAYRFPAEEPLGIPTAEGADHISDING
jgi:hypothetical protein